jgi:SAM-dependent methyltransferase
MEDESLFFPEKITLIRPGDRVLEVGPGGTPHPRSNIFLELKYDDECEWRLQRGNVDGLKTNNPVIYYDGNIFPFSDKEFDYIICSHVLEHVENIRDFLSELFRVGCKGYIEYPTIYYEYLYNFSVHLNFLRLRGNKLLYLKKSSTRLNDFSSVQSFFYGSLEKGHRDLVNALRNYMFEGFEWSAPFPVEEAHSISQMALDDFELPVNENCKCSIEGLLKYYFSKIYRRL